MNAKHLFLTLLMLLAGVNLASGTVKDIISFTNVDASYGASIKAMGSDGDFPELADCAFTSEARYTGMMFYSSAESKLGFVNLEAFSTTVSGGKLKSIRIYWDASTDVDEGIRLCLNTDTPYAGGEDDPVSSSDHYEDFSYNGIDADTYFDDFDADYQYLAIIGYDLSYVTSIEIEWAEDVTPTYNILQGTISAGATWGTHVVTDKTTAKEGEVVTLTFTPPSKTKSLKSFSFDGMVIDLSCIGYVDFGEDPYTFSFYMPARDVTVDAVFGLASRQTQNVYMKDGGVTVSSTTIQSGIVKEFTFERVDKKGNAVTGGVVSYYIEDASLASVSLTDNGDGTGTCRITGLATGTCTFKIQATKTPTANAGSTVEITLTVEPRRVALLAESGGKTYVLTTSIAGDKGEPREVHKSSDGKYYFDPAWEDEITWKATTRNAAGTSFTYQDNSNKYLSAYEYSLSLESSASSPYVVWYKDVDRRKNKDDERLIYEVSTGKFSTSTADFSTAAKEYIINGDDFKPANEYSTSNSSAAIYDSRSLSAGSYGTLCIPFTVPEMFRKPGIAGEGAAFYTLDSKDVVDGAITGINIVPVDDDAELEAGKSYLYRICDGFTAITLLHGQSDETDVDINDKKDGFVGVLPGTPGLVAGKLQVPDGVEPRTEGCYGVSGGRISYIAAGATARLKIYRAYIDASELEVEGAIPSPKRIKLNMDLETQTTSEDIETDLSDLTDAMFINWDEPVYNVMGIQVGKGTTGVLIQNGQKFIVQ